MATESAPQTESRKLRFDGASEWFNILVLVTVLE